MRPSTYITEVYNLYTALSYFSYKVVLVYHQLVTSKDLSDNVEDICSSSLLTLISSLELFVLQRVNNISNDQGPQFCQIQKGETKCSIFRDLANATISSSSINHKNVTVSFLNNTYKISSSLFLKFQDIAEITLHPWKNMSTIKIACSKEINLIFSRNGVIKMHNIEFNGCGSETGIIQIKSGHSEIHIWNCYFIANAYKELVSVQGSLDLLNISKCTFKDSININHNTTGGILALHSQSSILAIYITKTDFKNYSDLGFLKPYSMSSSYQNITVDSCSFTNSTMRTGYIITLNNFKNVFISSCLFHENTGGVVAVISTTASTKVDISGNEFVNNFNKGNGGAVYAEASSTSQMLLYFRNNTFKKNSAHTGGAMHLKCNIMVIIKNSLFTGNVAKAFGGAISSDDSIALHLYGTVNLLDNEAEQGGAIYLANSSLFSWYSSITLQDNKAKKFGGAIMLATSSKIKLGNFKFIRNRADINGGAIYVSHSLIQFTMEQNNFKDNKATVNGGALLVTNSNVEVVSGSVYFIGNKAIKGLGGGVHVKGKSTLVLAGSEFIANEAFKFGGAISIVYSVIQFRNGRNLFMQNLAGSKGGAIYTAKSMFTLLHTKVEFIENRAKLGGAIFVEVNVNEFCNKAKKKGFSHPCFISTAEHNATKPLYFCKNHASEGSVLHGGLSNGCDKTVINLTDLNYCASKSPLREQISSKSWFLCFCLENGTKSCSTKPRHVRILEENKFSFHKTTIIPYSTTNLGFKLGEGEGSTVLEKSCDIVKVPYIFKAR